jgi:excisionase family DNA binding protein
MRVNKVASKKNSPISPITDQDMKLAEESRQKLSTYINSTQETAIRLVRKGKYGETIILPPNALQLLTKILSQMAEGNTVELVSVETELTTQQSADLLKVSRPFLVTLLEDKKIPFRHVGTRRRILAKDVLAYKAQIDKKRLAVLDDLANEAQKNNMGY